ncbi:N-terminal glutamine amidase-domain-containing protein [Panaeolus papilionaceus]|nr:N-terminal glutamine amidase-domain-containing protein [Panaeolus papilionaceus]
MIPPPVPIDKIYTSCYCEENVYLLCRRFLEHARVRENWQPFAVFMSNANKTVSSIELKLHDSHIEFTFFNIVLYMSNGKMEMVDLKVALWNQKNGREEGMPVVWDYHVVLVLRPRNMQIGVDAEAEGGELQEVTAVPEGECWVYDFDSRLESPCPWNVYFNGTFPEDVVEKYASQFRVVEGSMFLQTFASDRSHMLAKSQLGDGAPSTEYIAPPPPYPPIQGTLAAQEGDINNLMRCFVDMTMVEGEGLGGKYGLVLERDEVDELFV